MVYLTVKEVAKRLSCGENKVYDLLKAKKLPYFDIQTKPGGRRAYRIPETALETLCNPSTVIPAQPARGSFRERYLNSKNRLKH